MLIDILLKMEMHLEAMWWFFFFGFYDLGKYLWLPTFHKLEAIVNGLAEYKK